MTNATITLADVCVVACAEAWRGDGEILASPIGVIPMVAVRLAAMTFEPDLVYTDGDAYQLAEPIAVDATFLDRKEGFARVVLAAALTTDRFSTHGGGTPCAARSRQRGLDACHLRRRSVSRTAWRLSHLP